MVLNRAEPCGIENPCPRCPRFCPDRIEVFPRARCLGWRGFSMSTKSKRPLEDRVREAAEGALVEQGYVSLIDVLTRVGYLHPTHVDGWRKGRVASLEEWIFVAPENILKVMALFHDWARSRNLSPSETAHLAPTVGPAR